MSSVIFLRRIVMCTLLSMLFFASASAVVIEDLYDAKVPVTDQAEATQNKAIKQALKQVFVKVSGSQTLLNDEQIVKHLSRASTLIRSYSYERKLNQLFLVVNFDQEKIQNALRTAGFAVWDKRRPDTLLWLAIEDKQQDKYILNADNQPMFVQRLIEQAQIRGIRVGFPLWDLNDMQLVDVYTIWGGFAQQIASASERYDHKTLLSARIYFESIDPSNDNSGKQQWLADWTMSDNGQVTNGQVSGPQSDLLADEIINVVAQQLSDKYAISQQNRLLNAVTTKIVINNVNAISRYAAVLKFLNGLSVVSKATLISQQGEKATFELELLGNTDDLLNTFRLDNIITPVSSSPGQEQTNLEFKWAN